MDKKQSYNALQSNSFERKYLNSFSNDGCPLFSERLEEHLVAVSRGESPATGRFCGFCFTPTGPDTKVCSHCQNNFLSDKKTVEIVPSLVTEILREQRKIEARFVNGFAYLGVLLAVLGGLAVVLGIPYLRDHLIPATIVYALILLVGVRILAGILGGYFGDNIGYNRARKKTVQSWEELKVTIG
ncbi:MAG: hypothetical protein CL792_04565 [Chloroflexi bacterium]|nr:hypothetical protein [Chloroflexota bacterium]|tara:strand:- start:197 stop:751 length:555 start_codon:yes stop_codon:yes gene_type:complete